MKGRWPSWSPAGDRLAFLDAPGNLWLLNVPARRATCLWAGAAAAAEALGPLAPLPCRLEWSADARYIAVFLPTRPPGSSDYAVQMTVLEVPSP